MLILEHATCLKEEIFPVPQLPLAGTGGTWMVPLINQFYSLTHNMTIKINDCRELERAGECLSQLVKI